MLFQEVAMTKKPYHSASLEELQVLSINIFGEPASKSNSRRVVKFGGVSRLIKSEKALNYSAMFKQQCPVIDRALLFKHGGII